MKNFCKNKWYVLLPALLFFVMASCELLDTEKELTAEDAKMELRAAGNDIMNDMGEMMATPAMSSLMYLSNMMGIELEEMKSMPADGLAEGKQQSAFVRLLGQQYTTRQPLMLPGASRVMALLHGLSQDKSEMDMTQGVYHYNFSTDEFDLINGSVSYLELHFPADDEAYESQERNAKLRVNNLQITTVTYYDEDYEEYVEEEVPTRFDLTLTVDNEQVMTASYNASLNEIGIPVSVSLSMDMPPYSMTLTHSGTNQSYTTKGLLKINSSNLLAIDMRTEYTDDDEEVEKADGSITVYPLSVKGNIRPSDISWCEDIDCMNDNIDMDVFQTELDKKIGTLEFRMKDGYPELAIVYEDDSHEFLADIFEEEYE